MSRTMTLFLASLFILSTTALAGAASDDKDAAAERLPSVEMDEKEKEALLEDELQALEQATDDQALDPGQIRRSGAMGLRGGQNPANICRDRCAAQAEASASQGLSSFAISAAYQRCMEDCSRVQDLANDYMRCISNAMTAAEREACRADYRDNRWR